MPPPPFTVPSHLADTHPVTRPVVDQIQWTEILYREWLGSPATMLRTGGKAPEGVYASLIGPSCIYDLCEKTVRIGRDPALRNGGIHLPARSISKVHAEINFGDDGKYPVLKDLNSMNGTFVDDCIIRGADFPVPLTHGNYLRFGCDHQSFLFALPGHDAPVFNPPATGEWTGGRNSRAAGQVTRSSRDHSPLSPVNTNRGRSASRERAKHANGHADLPDLSSKSAAFFQEDSRAQPQSQPPSRGNDKGSRGLPAPRSSVDRGDAGGRNRDDGGAVRGNVYEEQRGAATGDAPAGALGRGPSLAPPASVTGMAPAAYDNVYALQEAQKVAKLEVENEFYKKKELEEYKLKAALSEHGKTDDAFKSQLIKTLETKVDALESQLRDKSATAEPSSDPYASPVAPRRANGNGQVRFSENQRKDSRDSLARGDAIASKRNSTGGPGPAGDTQGQMGGTGNGRRDSSDARNGIASGNGPVLRRMSRVAAGDSDEAAIDAPPPSTTELFSLALKTKSRLAGLRKFQKKTIPKLLGLPEEEQKHVGGEEGDGKKAEGSEPAKAADESNDLDEYDNFVNQTDEGRTIMLENSLFEIKASLEQALDPEDMRSQIEKFIGEKAKESERKLEEQTNALRQQFQALRYEENAQRMAAMQQAMDEGKPSGPGQKGIEYYASNLQRKVDILTEKLKEKSQMLDQLKEKDWARTLMETKAMNATLTMNLHQKAEELALARSDIAKLTSAMKGTKMGGGSQMQMQQFITEQSQEMMNARRQVAEMERRTVESGHRWSVLLNENEEAAKKMRQLQKQLEDQAESFQAMLSQRDGRLMEINMKLASLASAGDPSKRAAAEFLVAQLHAQENTVRNEQMQIQQMRAEYQALHEENEELARKLQEVQSSRPHDQRLEQRIHELEDELTELRNQGSVQRLIEQEDLTSRVQTELGAERAHVQALTTELNKIKAKVQYIDEDSAVEYLSQVITEKDNRIAQLESELQYVQSQVNMNKEELDETKRLHSQAVAKLQMVKERNAKLATLREKHGGDFDHYDELSDAVTYDDPVPAYNAEAPSMYQNPPMTNPMGMGRPMTGANNAQTILPQGMPHSQMPNGAAMMPQYANTHVPTDQTKMNSAPLGVPMNGAMNYAPVAGHMSGAPPTSTPYSVPMVGVVNPTEADHGVVTQGMQSGGLPPVVAPAVSMPMNTAGSIMTSTPMPAMSQGTDAGGHEGIGLVVNATAAMPASVFSGANGVARPLTSMGHDAPVTVAEPHSENVQVQAMPQAGLPPNDQRMITT